MYKIGNRIRERKSIGVIERGVTEKNYITEELILKRKVSSEKKGRILGL